MHGLSLSLWIILKNPRFITRIYVKEEIGITLEKSSMVFIERLKRTRSFVDIWMATADFKISDCVLDPDEVADIKWVSANELIDMVFEAEYRDSVYISVVEKFVK